MIDRIYLDIVTRADVLAAAKQANWPPVTTPSGEHLSGEASWKRGHLGYAVDRRKLLEQLTAMRDGDAAAR